MDATNGVHGPSGVHGRNGVHGMNGVQGSRVQLPLQRPSGAHEPNRVGKDEANPTAQTKTPQKDARTDVVRGLSTSAEILSLERSLPIAILKNPQLEKTEWAWRRLLSEAIVQTNHESPDGPGVSGESVDHLPLPTANQTLTGAIRTLWTVLSQTAEQSREGSMYGETATLPRHAITQLPTASQSQDGGTLISFHHVRDVQTHNELPAKVQAWVVEDRLVGSTRTPDGSISGMGLWATPSTNQDGPQTVVHWKASRQTKVGYQGTVVHRVTLVIPYEGKPVGIRLVCAYPSVNIHISTDHKQLAGRLVTSEPQIRNVLYPLGWSVDGWTVGDWEEDLR